jgi:transcriptional regulator with XRE-family HTH domain
MKEIGTKIRLERKKRGFTLNQLARRVRISPVTMHRIETGKSSPSVALLSEIALSLKRSLYSFVQEADHSFVHIKRKDQQSISSPALKIKLIGPRKMITDKISVTYGELKKGKSIDSHSNAGIEWVYLIEGKCEQKLGEETIIQEPGDSFAFNARVQHSITALEKMKFFAIYVRNED